MLNHVVIFESKRMARNFPAMFFALAFPVMVLAIFGGIYGNDPAEELGGFGAVDISVAGYTGLILAVAGLMSFPLGMVEYRSRAFLRRLRATPARPTAFLTAQVIVNGLLCLVGLGILLIVAFTVYGLNTPQRPFAFAGLVLLAAAAMFGLGMMIASFAKSESTALVLANLIYFPMIFLTGATVPLEIMPEGMRRISDLLPMTHAVEALKWAWMDIETDRLVIAIIVLCGTIIVSSVVAAKWFRWE
ncbi:ABC transporter permease [Natronoglycomyces albus]|uniref:Transport permease protein n=1 Tax=Natronoglycomyces albus TaxID=2811108 RepID=A0A895XZ40_9ACTN|nr:ABC transporter permease [Natronoglycomyces albus]QSB06868.1 ABC transporter permease [Natronoglycomyces albus]